MSEFVWCEFKDILAFESHLTSIDFKFNLVEERSIIKTRSGCVLTSKQEAKNEKKGLQREKKTDPNLR